MFPAVQCRVLLRGGSWPHGAHTWSPGWLDGWLAGHTVHTHGPAGHTVHTHGHTVYTHGHTVHTHGPLTSGWQGGLSLADTATQIRADRKWNGFPNNRLLCLLGLYGKIFLCLCACVCVFGFVYFLYICLCVCPPPNIP